MMKRAHEIQVKIFGEQHPDTVINYIHIGELCKSMGNYEEAIEILEKALLIKEKNLGKGHLETAYLHNIIGLILADTGKYK